MPIVITTLIENTANKFLFQKGFHSVTVHLQNLGYYIFTIIVLGLNIIKYINFQK